MLCGQLERHFRGQTIFYITCPGSALWKPYKSRLFPRLIVHARPPFPFTFRFLPPVNAGGAVRAVFCPVRFWDEHAAADRTAFQVLSPKKSLLPASRPAARPTSGITYSRRRKKWSGGKCGCPHRQGRYSPHPHSCSTPGVSGCLPVSFAPVSCGRGSRPACAPRAAIACINFLSCVPPFPCCRSLQKSLS